MVYSLVWSPGDSLLLSASADGTAKVGRTSVVAKVSNIFPTYDKVSYTV